MVIIKTTENNKRWEDAEELELLPAAGGDVKWCSTQGGRQFGSPQKIKRGITT